LDAVAVSLDVSPLGLWAAGFSWHQTGIFDAVIEPIFDHRVIPINESSYLVVFPEKVAVMARFRGLEHEAQACIIAFVLDAPKASAPAFETYPFCFS